MKLHILKPRLPDALAALLLIGLPLLVFWQVWAPNPADRVMFGGDILMGAYPTRVFVHRLFALGQQPGWNPYQLAGMPLWGDIQVAPYYLPNYALDMLYRGREISYIAFEILVIAHYILGGLLLYGFVRNLKVGAVAALVGAIAFEFNGFFVGHRGHYNMLGVVAWLPGVLWLLDRAWQAQAPRAALAWGVGAGLVLSQLVMAGHPQLALYCSVMVAAYAAYRWAGDLRQPELSRTVRWLRVPALLALAGAIAGGIAAAALLPTVELLGRSLRSEPSYTFAAQYSLLPRNLIGLLAPDFLGWGATEFRIYAGVLTLVLAAVACVVPDRGVKERRFFALAALAALVTALGGFTIVHGLVYRFVPGFGSVRVSSRAFYLANLALAVLAAFGAEALLGQLRAAERRRLQQLARVCAGLLAAAAVFGAALYIMLVRNYQAVGEAFFFADNLFNRTPSDDAFTLATQTTNGWLLFVLLFGAAVALVWARAAGRLGGRAFAITAATLMFVDVATYAPYHDTLRADPETARFTVKQYATQLLDAPWKVTDQQQLIDAVSQLPDGVRVDNAAEVLPDNYSAVYRAAFATGYNILDLEDRFALLNQWPNLSGTVKNDLLNVGYVLTAADAPDPPEADAKLLIENSQGKLWQRARQPSYAHFSTSVRPATTSITLNGLLSRGQALDAQPTIAVEGGGLDETLERLWPEAVDPGLYQVGTTGVTSPVDIGVLAGGPIKYSAVIVDGTTVTPEQRGIVIALIDPATGKVLASGGYDTYLSTAESARLTATINAAPNGTIVALATYDEGTARLDDAARAAIASLGATTNLKDQAGAAYALVGVKGGAAGSALERIDKEAVVVDVGVGAHAAAPDATFSSKLVSYEPERISLLVQNSARGVFAVSEAVFPGWTAYVDGLETPIVRVNGLQRGVILPSALAGQAHEVTFVYAPLSARLGRAISLLTLALALSALAALLLPQLAPLRRRWLVRTAPQAS